MMAVGALSLTLLLAAAAPAVGRERDERTEKGRPTMMRAYMQALYDAVPWSIDEVGNRTQWKSWRKKTLADLRRTLGLMPWPKKTPLNARVVRTLDRGDHLIDMVILQTRPNFFMTANFYRPREAEGRLPAVLAVHGHTMQGKTAQSMQLRCINYVRAGWVALAVDATGHGERRHIGHRQTFAIVTTGMTLEGVQVWDNIRCLDYLLSRPDVDPKRILITGSSGGGNQTMYTAALEERFACAAPVASVSTLRGQIFTNNGIGCQCECVPNLMRAGLENAVVLGLIAPRPLGIVHDQRDPVFPFRYTKEADARLRRFYEAIGYGDRYTLSTVRARRHWHGYAGLARAAGHRWIDKTFNQRAEERPFREHSPPLEMDQDLFCFQAGRLPEDSETLGTLAYAVGREQVARIKPPATPAAAGKRRAQIRDNVLGGWPDRGPMDARETAPVTREGVTRCGVTLTTEPGITVSARIVRPAKAEDPLPCIVLVRPTPTRTDSGKDTRYPRVRGRRTFSGSSRRYWQHKDACLAAGYALAEFDGRPMGGDEHVSRAALVYGRPLVGMGAYDISRFVEHLRTREDVDGERISLWAEDEMALPALYAVALDTRIAGTTLVGLVTTYVTPNPVQHPTWTFARGLLKYADIAHLAALAAPRRLVIANPVGPDLKPVSKRRLNRAFRPARQAYGRAGDLTILTGSDEEVLKAVIGD